MKKKTFYIPIKQDTYQTRNHHLYYYNTYTTNNPAHSINPAWIPSP